MLRLIFLGKLGDVAPADLAEVALPGDVKTLSDLRDWVGRTAPLLARATAGTSAGDKPVTATSDSRVRRRMG